MKNFECTPAPKVSSATIQGAHRPTKTYSVPVKKVTHSESSGKKR